MKYRKKPIVIEAIQLTRNFAEVCLDFIGIENVHEYNLGEFPEDMCYISIETLEGIINASENDFIIKGINGEFYPCKPDIFEKTYEKVENE